MALFLLSSIPVCQSVLPTYLMATAWLANALLHAVGEVSQIAETSIWSLKYSVTVADKCSGLELAWFLGATLLAFPATWGKRLLGAALGFVFLSVLNVLRVASLYLIGVHGTGAFAVIHEDAWPALMILATVVGASAWIAWALPKERLEGHAAA
ncbi:MAG: archaeosortase/exosortase family protein [Chthoniobacteraceae bacterium]